MNYAENSKEMGRYRKSELLELISNMYLNSGDSKEARVFPEPHDILMFTDKSIDEIVEEFEEWKERYEKYSGAVGGTSDNLIEDAIRSDIDTLYLKGRRAMKNGDPVKAKAFFDKADALYWEIGKELIKQSEPWLIKRFESKDPLPLLSPEYLTKNNLWQHD